MFTPNVPKQIETQTYALPLPPQTAQMATVVKPLSYQFQVVEYEKDNAVVKVELQVQETIHDERGNVIRSSGFVAVPRIRLPFIDHT